MIKVFRYLLQLVGITIILMTTFGCNGESFDFEEDQLVSSVPTNLVNPPRNNLTHLGFSSFAIGVDSKFPIDDVQQPDGIGYKTIARSVRNILTNDLWSFPERPRNEQQIIETLSEFIDAGHSVRHVIYVFNGPGMRAERGDTYLSDVFGYDVTEEEFIEMINGSQSFRDQIRSIFSNVVAHAKLLQELGVDVYICPELEDNHSDNPGGSYGKLLSLLYDAGWTDRSKVIRNSVRNTGFPGIGIEVHPHSLEEFNRMVEKLQPGDFVNTDGNGFELDTDDYANDSPPLIQENELRIMIEQSELMGLNFAIWSPELQGYRFNGTTHVKFPSHRVREYTIPKPVEWIAILLGVDVGEVEVKM